MCKQDLLTPSGASVIDEVQDLAKYVGGRDNSLHKMSA